MATTTLGMSKTYNLYSIPQKAAVQLSIDFIEEAIDVLDVASVDTIADFGSSHGANAIYAMKTIIDCLRKRNKLTKEPLVIHNDLPTNDWPSFFEQLNNDRSYHGVASGRSFYEQCLPSGSLAVAHSSTSIHWLSRKPCNISNHCFVGFAGRAEEREAFERQAYLDYSHFLQHRSRELLAGGVLILNNLATNDRGKTGTEGLTELLYQCARLLPLTSQELLDFTLPVTFRSPQQWLDENLFTQHSFQFIQSKSLLIESSIFKQWKDEQITLDEYVHLTSSFARGWSESIIQQTLVNNQRKSGEILMLSNQF